MISSFVAAAGVRRDNARDGRRS